MTEKKRRPFGQKLVLGVAFALIVCYTVYHMTSLFEGELSTYAAGVTTESTVLYESGYVFRNETVLISPYSGLISYEAESGRKVGQGQALATVYEGGGEIERMQLLYVDHQIEILEESYKNGWTSLDMGKVKANVSDTYNAIVKKLASREVGGLTYETDLFLTLLNQMNGLSQGEDASGIQALENLYKGREQLLASSGASISHSAEQSGYFYDQVDGYEAAFTLSAAEGLTGDSFERLLKEGAAEIPAGAYGKLCDSSEWMLVIPTELSNQSYFEAGEVYEGIFEKNNQTRLPLTLERIVEDPERDRALLVFRCDRLPDPFSFDRCQNVRLEVDSVRGIYVPKHIVERESGMRGVYVLRGSVVHFRYIDIVYEGSDYYLVKENVEDDGDRTYLKVNDQIILNGKNLFDGRIMD